MPDLIAIDAGPAQSVKIASRAGFVGLDLRFNRFADEIERLNPEAFADAMAAVGLRCGYCSITPQKIGVDHERWEEELADVPRRAALAATVGYRRATSVVVPFSETLDYDANFAMHVKRIRQAADILADHGIWFGLEYVSPKTRWFGKGHEFVRNLDGMLEMLDAVDRPNVGVMLDSFHWCCAGETADDLRRLRPEQIVAVHVCDLLEDVPIDEQDVRLRASAGETGLVDMATFLRTLDEIGYDGPITAEPTHPRWKEMAPEEAASITAWSIRDCFENAGLTVPMPSHAGSRGPGEQT
ncbi:MAG: sugar phosphate isomerase/epimerase [Phycisphaeraceae bacterium]|nr:MAG: sugar phosphate isomerase/epimerase [Phycisphaeraceae bacterium]